VQNFAATLWLAGSILLFWRSWRFIQGTTLESAWRWGASAWSVWGVAWALELNASRISAGVLDQLWYAVGG